MAPEGTGNRGVDLTREHSHDNSILLKGRQAAFESALRFDCWIRVKGRWLGRGDYDRTRSEDSSVPGLREEGAADPLVCDVGVLGDGELDESPGKEAVHMSVLLANVGQQALKRLWVSHLIINKYRC